MPLLRTDDAGLYPGQFLEWRVVLYDWLREIGYGRWAALRLVGRARPLDDEERRFLIRLADEQGSPRVPWAAP